MVMLWSAECSVQWDPSEYHIGFRRNLSLFQVPKFEHDCVAILSWIHHLDLFLILLKKDPLRM
jgi:hypothetical protein